MDFVFVSFASLALACCRLSSAVLDLFCWKLLGTCTGTYASLDKNDSTKAEGRSFSRQVDDEPEQSNLVS